VRRRFPREEVVAAARGGELAAAPALAQWGRRHSGLLGPRRPPGQSAVYCLLKLSAF
jgi:hypothetical protein